MKKYNLAVCGGTFDHFHKGHKEFLRYCLSIGKKLLIGITSDKFIKNKSRKENIESYKMRYQQLEKFLRQENAINSASIQPIDDVFIPKEWENLSIEAIVVTNDTILGAKKINLRRIEQGKVPLKIEVFPSIRSRNKGYISSSKIRSGEIDREGLPYVNPLWFKKSLLITNELRRVFKRPFGTLLVKNKNLRCPDCSYIITVGDVTTKNFNSLGINQDISIVDFKVARKKEFSNFFELGFCGKEKVIKIVNPPGRLTPALFKAASQVFELRKKYDQVIIAIEGEEDLSVLPLALTAPLGSVIYYGQPHEGVVKVDISEKSKKMAYRLVSQFNEVGHH